MSRHWSDVAVMTEAEQFSNAKLSLELLRQVVRFKQVYFPAAWAHYDMAVPPTLRVVPNAALASILNKDYEEMREMFPADALSFEKILDKLSALEVRINAWKEEAK
jgi:hypothetical protein